MIRTVTTTILAAFVLAGTAWGQSPGGSQDTPANLPAANDILQPTPKPVPTPASAIPGDVPDGGVHDTALWGSVSYMLGWVQGDHLPFLVTTSPAGTPRAAAGVLPNTTPLFGGTAQNQQSRSGVQGDLGYWFDPQHQAAIEGGFFYLQSRNSPFFASSDGSTILARPYVDAQTNTPSSSLAAYPGLSAGSIRISEDSHQIWSGNIDFRENFFSGTYWRLDSLLGYRYFQLNERLLIQQGVQPIGGPFVPGTTISSTDSFVTGNIFNGVDLGVRGTFTYDAFSLDLTGKVSAGRVTQQLTINGYQVVTVPGASPVTSEGGLLALATNIGSHGTHSFTVIPEIGILLNYQVNQYTNLRFGYSAQWLVNFIRPGLEIDTTINPTQIPPTTLTPAQNEHPIVMGNTTYVLVQGITFGVEFRY